MGLFTTLDITHSDSSVSGLIFFIALTFPGYVILKVLANIYWHPLSDYPGPRLAAATRLWYCYHSVQGNLVHVVHELHQKYGDVVRIAPNELSYTNPEAWNDIYGHRIGKDELMKDPLFYSSLSSGPGSIISADRARHGHLRKQASHGFSERALRSQEHVIIEYADLMMKRLDESAKSDKPTVDIVDWFNFFTFDVMGDLVFGQSFDCLENWGYHPWVKLIFDSVKAGTFIRCLNFWPVLAPLKKYLMPSDIRKRRIEHQGMAKEKADYRRSIDDGRQDLISGFLMPESGVTLQEYGATVATLIIAGSETTATLMSGLTYYILRDSDRAAKLKAEIRNAFSNLDEIDYTNVNKLPYLLACLDEALRIYPPVAETFPRNTGPSAEVICGKTVPPWTIIGVHHWSTYHSPQHFERPDEFIPERWLADSKEWPNDRKEAVQAFAVGPRNCLGRNLAYFEMRILIARLFWSFDLELQPESAQWNQQKAYILWEKPPMIVKLSSRT